MMKLIATMDTYPIFRKGESQPFAFEIENAYIRPTAIAHLLSEIDGVTEVRARRLFTHSDDIHVEFKYLDRDYIVWEPYGDSSRYWIGPKDQIENSGNISDVEEAFKRYQLPVYRKIIGDILSFRFISYLWAGIIRISRS